MMTCITMRSSLNVVYSRPPVTTSNTSTKTVNNASSEISATRPLWKDTNFTSTASKTALPYTKKWTLMKPKDDANALMVGTGLSQNKTAKPTCQWASANPIHYVVQDGISILKDYNVKLCEMKILACQTTIGIHKPVFAYTHLRVNSESSSWRHCALFQKIALIYPKI